MIIKFLERIGIEWERISQHKILAWVFILPMAVYFIYLAFTSDMSEGGGDAIVHYRMARYAFKYPHLFLDMWGKPLLTFFSAPFAQFGFNAMKLFNILVFILTGIIGFRFFKGLGIPHGILYGIILFSAPMYFILVPSTMTEPLFGMLLLLSVLLFFQGHYTATIILVSFLPFSRNEGIIIFPFYILALLMLRQWKALPFILTGHILFWILGWIVHGDITWILKQMPYLNTGSGGYQYPGGDFWHYPDLLPVLYGKFLYWLACLGSAIILLRTLLYRNKRDIYLLLLVVLPGITYVAAHSWVFWKGTAGAAGLERIMAPMVPLFALCGLYGFHIIYKSSGTILKPFILGIFLLLLANAVRLPFERHTLPTPLGLHESLITEVVAWVNEEGLNTDMVYYYHPYIVHKMNKDPYDLAHVQEGLPRDGNYGSKVPEGALIFWDTHFGPHEGMTPLERLMSEKSFTFVRSFPTDTTAGKAGFMVYIFQKSSK